MTVARPAPPARRAAPRRKAWGASERARAAAAALAAFAALGLAGEAAARCQPASYCSQPGACLSIGQVKAQAARKFGPAGWRVGRVRLRGHAPSPTCLWYEVVLQHPSRPARSVYWNITGGQAR